MEWFLGWRKNPETSLGLELSELWRELIELERLAVTLPVGVPTLLVAVYRNSHLIA